MMKKRHVLHLAMGVVMTPLLGSCAFDELHEIAGGGNAVLSFGVEVNAGAPEVKPMGGATRSAEKNDSNAVMSPDVEGFFPTSSIELSSVDGKTLYANCDERRGINMHNNVDYKITRGSIKSTNDFYSSFALYGYVYDGGQTWSSVSGSTSVNEKINGIPMTKGNGSDYNASGVYWPGGSNKATFFAVAPYSANQSVTANQGGPQITYTVPQDVSNQEDLLVAVAKNVKCDGKNAPSLTFNHALAAIKFKMGELGGFTSISNVEISGVYNNGILSSFETPSWTEQTKDGSTNTYSISSLNDVLFLMPQTFTDDAKIKVTFSDGSNSQDFTAKLKDNTNTSWQAGHQYTYSLSINKVTGTFKFEVTQSPANVSTSGGDVTYTVKSVFVYSTGDNSVKIPWQATYSLDGVTPTTKSGNGGDPSKETLSDAKFTISVPASETTRTHKKELENRNVKGDSSDPFDLSKEYNGKVNTANCYVITSPGFYKLPLVYGNAVKDGDNNKIAYKSETFVDHTGTHITQPYIYDTTYGPVKAILLWQDAPELVTNCSLIKENNKNKYLKFEVSSENIDQGNAVIAVQNSSGTTLWSWHIWVTDHAYRSTIAVKNTTSQTAYFMPMPLGWCDPSGSTGASKEYIVYFSQTTSGGSSLVKTIGQEASLITAGNAPFYQWGRKDPFVGSTGESSNTTKTWYDGSGNKKTNTNPVASRMTSKAETIQYPEQFISSWSGYWDTNSTYDNWNANVTDKPASGTEYNDNPVVKTVYDPSPVGFKMPTTNAFTGFGSESTVNCEGSWDYGYKFKTSSSSPNPISIYFRANGYRYNNDGSLRDVTTGGYYWASGLASYLPCGCLLYFLQDSVNPQYDDLRAKGFSVRPVSE